MMRLKNVLVQCLFAFSLLYSGSHAVDSLRFVILGDMGGIDFEPYSTYFERCTAKEMGKLASVYAPQYILSLGDNFYFDGVTDVNDFRFNRTFESIYTDKSLYVPWYLIAGNHDHNGNVSAQIEYSKISKRWNFPDYYYYKEFTLAGFSVGFVMMDSVQLCGNTDDRVDKALEGPLNSLQADAQWQFIEKSLQTSKSEYLFTAGHYPVYSIAEHGPTQCLIDGLQPMLDKYIVNGHLSGHDHNLQHLRVKSSQGASIDYFVSGMANFAEPSMKHATNVPAGSSLFYNGDIFLKGGFLYAEATAKNMTLTFIGATGARLYSTVVFPRKSTMN